MMRTSSMPIFIKISPIISLILVVLTVNAQPRQTSYKITGFIENVSNVYIYLQPGFGAAYGQKDSIFSSNGEFSFSGTVTEPTFKSIYVQGQRLGFAFILEPGELLITGNVNDMNNAKIKAGTENDIYNQYREIQKERRKDYTKLMDHLRTYRENGDTLTYNKYNEQWKSWGDQQRMADYDFIRKYPASFTAVIICRSILGAPELVTKWLAHIDQSLHNNSIYKEVKYRADVDLRIGLGKTAPDFKQPKLNGGDFRLSSLKGKYVLLDFWASWCLPCRKESPNLVKLYTQFASKGFEIVSISLDSEKTPWSEAAIKDQYSWINVSDLKGYNCAAAALYGVSLIPRNFLLDPEGKIIAIDKKTEELARKLSELLDK